jgi:hypothetical protein
MSTLMASQLWDVFTGAGGGMEKIAGLTEDYLRNRIRETCVANRVISPIVLTEATIDTNTQNDMPLKRVWLEPESKAFTIGFRGRGQAQFVEGRKYEVWFDKLETEHFKKTQEELMTMRFPLIDVVNANFVFDLQEQVDFMFKARLDASAQANASTNVISVGSGTVKGLFKDAVIQGVRAILGRRRRAARLIMTESCFLNLAKLEPDKVGYDIVGDIAMNGVYPRKTFLGYEVITSINSSNTVLQPGSPGVSIPGESVWTDDNIYCVTAPEFLGSNFMLRDVQQEMDRKGNMLEWYSWTNQGIEIGNVSSVSVITGIASLT